MGLNSALWRGKRVLVTGHTGFKGAWLTFLLRDLGAEVIGLSLPPESPQSLFVNARISEILSANFFIDIRDEFQVASIIKSLHIDYVFHLAAQAYVLRSVKHPLESITTNIIGTTNVLLSSLANESVTGITIATTDKVYENLGENIRFVESDKLGGRDPYSASKAASEIVINSINITNNPLRKPITTVRAGNVIGGGDWGQDRLVPDLVRALSTDNLISIRNPNATRPWQHVLDCLHGYLLVGQSHLEKKEHIPKAINFGPGVSLTVIELVNLFENAFNKRATHNYQEIAIPESERLELESNLAYSFLGWKPSISQRDAVKQTAEWYLKFASGRDAQELIFEEIANFKLDKW